MFNSQKINNDPKPYEVVRSGERIAVGGYWESGSAGGLTEYKPRPEYDNNPNPILEAVRNDLGNKQPYWTDMEVIERWAGNTGLNAQSGEYPTYSAIWALRQAYPGYVTHARKVLERLVNVYGEENK